MAREFTAKKVTGKELFSLGIKESKDIVNTSIPEYSDKTDAQQLVWVLNASLQDFKAGRYWIAGKPVKSGIYLVEMDDKFNVVKVSDDVIDSINDKPVTEIKRHFLLHLNLEEKKSGI